MNYLYYFDVRISSSGFRFYYHFPLVKMLIKDKKEFCFICEIDKEFYDKSDRGTKDLLRKRLSDKHYISETYKNIYLNYDLAKQAYIIELNKINNTRDRIIENLLKMKEKTNERIRSLK